MAMNHAQDINHDKLNDHQTRIAPVAPCDTKLSATFECNHAIADRSKIVPSSSDLDKPYQPIPIDAIVSFYAAGRLTECVQAALNLIETEPHNPFLRNILGAARARQSQFKKARDDFRKALALKPDYAEAYNNLGNALKEENELESAIYCYKRAIFLTPDYADAHCNAGNALKQSGLIRESIISYKIAAAIKPDSHITYNNLGIALKESGDINGAITSYGRAISVNPSYADAYNNLGLALRKKGEISSAMMAFQTALSLSPANSRAYNNLGNVLCDFEQIDQAAKTFYRAHQINPGFAVALWNHSLIELLQGEFETGFAKYEWRIHRRELRKTFPLFNKPRWDGTVFPDKIIFIHSEQGLGDTLQFIRYINVLNDLGMRPIVSVQKSLIPLLSYSFPGLEIKREPEVPEQFDYFIPLMSLPHALRTNSQTIPSSIPYLYADPERVEKWRGRLGPGGFKIGVCWQGSAGRVDKGRSFQLQELMNIARMPGVRLISLHKGAGESQLANLPEGLHVETLGEDFDPPGSAFLDTAAVMALCDLIITSDTSVAHLAGALGVPVWVVLKHIPDWRWLLDRADSPWYPSMRLFRQDTAHDWRSAFAKIESALNAILMDKYAPAEVIQGGCKMTHVTRPLAPVSWGEVIDKITILEIKHSRLKDEQALINVRFELDHLNRIFTDNFHDSDTIYKLKQDLFEVNDNLWEIEDLIRKKERENAFDNDFIHLARLVYKTNDERARIKKMINFETRSEIIEEKGYANYV